MKDFNNIHACLDNLMLNTGLECYILIYIFAWNWSVFVSNLFKKK